MLYNTYKLYIDHMSTEPTPPVPPESAMPPPVDVSFRPQELRIEVTVSHARAHLPELLDDIRDGGIVYLTRYGKRLAALVPPAAAEHLERSEDAYWASRARAAMESDGPAIPWEHVVAELEVVDNR
jgi:antitoxin (DNA-binding transcriptional repressor) of toxin-antitoxin stability system